MLEKTDPQTPARLPAAAADAAAAQTQTPALDLDGLRIQFPLRRQTVTAVDGIALSVQPGEILGVVGESGAGKSTIGNAVMGLLESPGRMTDGAIRLKGQRIDHLDDQAKRRLRGRRISMIFQDPLTSLNPLRTVEDQLVETMQLHLRVGAAEARHRAVDLLEAVGIPDPRDRVKNYPHQFSGGMRQRVVIALALCAEPEVVIADEPTTALDVSIQAQILDLLRRMVTERGVGMILITHDMGVIAEITDRVAVMYRGQVVEEGATAKILGDPDHPYTQSLISAVPRPDKRLHRFPRVNYIEEDKTHLQDVDLSSHWLGQGRSDQEQKGQPLIDVQGLGMRFLIKDSLFAARRQYLDAVKDVSFQIRQGEVFGLVGESGSGKSTVARLLTRLYTPSAGQVFFGDTDIAALRTDRALDPFRRQMQMIFQDPYSSLNPRMKVKHIIAEPMLFHGLVETKAEARTVVLNLLDVVGLGAQAADRYPHEFSGGQRQRISIARALATRPRFLICDEPTSALDVSIQAQILNLLKDLQETLGLTMLFISHDLPVIRQMCDRVGVMKRGQLLELAPTEDLFTAPRHEYSKHLLDLMPRLDAIHRRRDALT